MLKFQIALLSFGVLLSTTLTVCNASQIQSTLESAKSGIPNPASVYCEQQGNKLEIQTAADGSQSGVCVFPDGSTCDEWAYIRGECGAATPTSPTPGMTFETTTEARDSDPGDSNSGGNNSVENASGGYIPPGTTEEISDWWGLIKATKPGAQYDDYFERQDLGQVIYFGIDSMDPAIKAQIDEQCDSGKIVHLYGTLFSNVPDYNGSQIQVDRIEISE